MFNIRKLSTLNLIEDSHLLDFIVSSRYENDQQLNILDAEFFEETRGYWILLFSGDVNTYNNENSRH